MPPMAMQAVPKAPSAALRHRQLSQLQARLAPPARLGTGEYCSSESPSCEGIWRCPLPAAAGYPECASCCLRHMWQCTRSKG
jgi:hypothetical protein